MRRMLAVDAGDGWRIVYLERRFPGDPVAVGLLRRGTPRGAVNYADDADGVACATRARVQGATVWRHTSLAAWARRGEWGLIDGVPFNRARLREVIRRYPWAAAAPWATVPTDDWTILVMRGPRGQRALVMRGAESARPECTGRALVGGAR